MSTREYRSMICDACGKESNPVKWPETPAGWVWWNIDRINEKPFTRNLRHLCPVCACQVDKFLHGEGE